MSVVLHSPEIEMAVLSLVMQYPEEMFQRLSVENITSDHFYDHKNSVIFNGMLKIHRSGKEVELISFVDELNRTGELEKIGGRPAVSEIYTYTGSKTYLSDHLDKLRSYRARRIASNATSNALSELETENPIELAKIAKKAFEDISEALSTSSGVKTAKEACEEFVKRLVEDREAGDTPGIQTGLKSLDVATGGLRKRELWVFAGKTSAGKSVLTLQCVANALNLGKKCAVFSLEMGAQEVAARLASCMFNLDFGDLMNPMQISPHQMGKIQRAIADLATKPLWVVDEAGLTIEAIEAKAIQLRDSNGLDLLAVDYVQLVDVADKGQARHEQIAKITRDLKQLAKKLNVPIITASQLNDDGRLRESRAIGHDADVVALIEDDKIGMEKNRNGIRGTKLPLQMNGRFQRFEQDYSNSN